MKTTAVIALVGLAASAFTLPAAAQNAFYAGASIGQSTARDFCNGLSGPGVSCDDQATAFDLTGVGSWSFASQFSVFGRFGFYRSDVKSDARSPASAPPRTARQT